MLPFVNRELSWLSFNARVLDEAAKKENLPLDRLNFLAITASNMDEFFMVRVAYLHDRIKNDSIPDESGLTPKEQLEKTLTRSKEFQLEQAKCFNEIVEKLGKNHISFVNMNELSDKYREFVCKMFRDEILPVITPLAIDPSRPFPFLSNLSLNICVRMCGEENENIHAVIQVPSILPRFIRIHEENILYLLPLEELIAFHLSEICNSYKIRSFTYFRITRSADFDVDEDTDNLMEEMKRTIKKRKRGHPIRLELSEGFDERTLDFLSEMLHIKERYIMSSQVLLDLSSLIKVASLPEYNHLRTAPILPAHVPDFLENEDIFALIRERDRMLHHPYGSFDHVVDFIKKSASDPLVLAIKQTLYRVSGHSQIIAALEQAVEAGKQVTVLLELKARFDEENNIQWAAKLERAGCHVIYGLTGLKTHCKITLVVRRDDDGIRRYLHLSTGNYNDVTARIYTDIGMFTCRPAFGDDASAFFNHLTGFTLSPNYHKFIVAPEYMKRFFLDRIDKEIKNAKNSLPCGISIKINSLLDSAVIYKLYEASQAGVPVKLLVRGICSLLPGVPGVSENIQVRSIIGQLLEHSRIFMFENAGSPLIYMGSADLMPRNLDRRVELVFPVEEPMLKQRVAEILDIMWQDNVCAWELSADGEYRRVEKTSQLMNSQTELFELARNKKNNPSRRSV